MGQRKISARQGRNWAKSKPGAGQKIVRAFARAIYVKFKLKWPRPSTVARGLIKFVILLAITSAPYWPSIFEEAPSTKEFVPYYLGAAVTLLFLQWAFNEFVTASNRREELENHRELTALEQRNLFNNMMHLANVPSANFDDTAFMDVIQRTLKTILHTVNEVTDSIDTKYFQVALLVFQPGQKVEVAARSGGPRQIRKLIDREKTMAFHVAKAKVEWQHVPDLKRDNLFAYVGLSQSDCPYRSVLLIPISYEKNDGTTEACGVVTIDSSRPYEFWNDTTSRRIYKQVIPFVRILAIMLRQHPERV
jgi:hypothetical protein